MRAFAFALVTEVLPLYPLRSKKKPTFLSQYRRFQNQDLDPAQIFRRSIKEWHLHFLLYLLELDRCSQNRQQIIYYARSTISNLSDASFTIIYQSAARRLNDSFVRIWQLHWALGKASDLHPFLTLEQSATNGCLRKLGLQLRMSELKAQGCPLVFGHQCPLRAERDIIMLACR